MLLWKVTFIRCAPDNAVSPQVCAVSLSPEFNHPVVSVKLALTVPDAAIYGFVAVVGTTGANDRSFYHYLDGDFPPKAKKITVLCNPSHNVSTMDQNTPNPQNH